MKIILSEKDKYYLWSTLLGKRFIIGLELNSCPTIDQYLDMRLSLMTSYVEFKHWALIEIKAIDIILKYISAVEYSQYDKEGNVIKKSRTQLHPTFPHQPQ